MRFSLGCELGYRVDSATTFVFNLQPARLPRQEIVRERLRVTPEIPVQAHAMPESANRYFRLRAEPGELKVIYEAEIDLDVRRDDPGAIAEVPLEELPFEVLPHLYPSRYCKSDRLAKLAEAEFGRLARGHARVAGLCNWIYDHLEYCRGTSDEHTSALVSLVDRAGVCRDFAHLGISLCRSLGIPARFVSAYAWRLQPPDFHAVFEAYLDGRWYLFDPTRQAALDGIVRIGVGRDAAEVAFASIYGRVQPTEMKVRIEPSGGDVGAEDERTADAISVSDL